MPCPFVWDRYLTRLLGGVGGELGEPPEEFGKRGCLEKVISGGVILATLGVWKKGVFVKSGIGRSHLGDTRNLGKRDCSGNQDIVKRDLLSGGIIILAILGM